MVVARRIQHLTELLCGGRRLSAHFSVNPDTHSEKVKFIIQPPELVGNSSESVLILAVLEFLARAGPELRITDRGHSHSDGTSEACFYIKHPLPDRCGLERRTAEPRAADPRGPAAPPAEQLQTPERHPAGPNAPDLDSMDTYPVRHVLSVGTSPGSAGPPEQRVLKRRKGFHQTPAAAAMGGGGLGGGDATAEFEAAAVEDDGEDDSEVDEEGVECKDVELVMSSVHCSKAKAIKALKAQNNDIVEAILQLTSS